MSTRTTGITMILCLAVAFVASAHFYPTLPAQLPSHWNAEGVVDGMLPKFWALFLSPFVMAMLFLLWAAIPFMEPLQDNLEKFRSGYNALFLTLQAFFLYEFVLIMLTALGHHFNLAQALAPALAVLLAAIAAVTKNSERNFFVGIRTPWTLASDEVWRKTHILGSWLIYFCALCCLAAAFAPSLLFALIIFPLGITILTTVIYSYVEFRHERV